MESFDECMLTLGYAVVDLVEAMRYKPEGLGIDSRWGLSDFSLT